MKKLSAVIILALIAVFSMTTLACSKTTDVSIAITKSPTGYANVGGVLQVVQGVDLDLAGGEITVTDSDGGTRMVPMTDENVKHDYDKNATLGNHDVKITYKQLDPAVLKVNVIADDIDSIAIKDAPADKAFKGDEINITNATITATRLSGKQETVNISTGMLSGYEANTLGGQTVTVTHLGATTTFDVTVYDPDSMTVKTNPTKTTYLRTDAAVDVSGGVLELSAAAGALKKDVNMSSQMSITAFNPYGKDYSNTVTQEITVGYLGLTAKYNITIQNVLDNAVSAVLDVIDSIMLTWDGVSAPNVSAQLATAAGTAYDQYLAFTQSQKDMINTTRRDKLIAVAFYAEYKEWEQGKDDLTQYLAGLEMANFGTTTAPKNRIYESYENVESIAASLLEFKTMIEGLIARFSGYTNTKIFGSLTVESALTELNVWYSSNVQKYASDMESINKAVQIYKDFASVTDAMIDQGTQLVAKGTQILAAYNILMNDADNVYIIYTLANFRTYLINMFYAYFNECDTAADDARSNALAEYYLPDRLSLLNSYAGYCIQYSSRADSSIVLWSGRYIQQIIDEIMEDEITWELYVYYYVMIDAGFSSGGNPVNVSIEFHCYYAMQNVDSTGNTVSYYERYGIMFGDSAFDHMLNTYLDLFDAYLEYASDEAPANDIINNLMDDLLLEFFTADTTRQVGLAIVLDAMYYYANVFYVQGTTPHYFFSNTGYYFGSILSYSLAGRYATDEIQFITAAFYLAEEYALYKMGAPNDFINTYDTYFAGRYVALSAGAFKSGLAKTINDRYTAFYNEVKNPPVAPALGEWQNVIDQIIVALWYINDAAVELDKATEDEGNEYRGIYFAAYYRACELEQKILTEAPAEIVKAYLNYMITEGEGEDAYQDFLAGALFQQKYYYFYLYASASERNVASYEVSDSVKELLSALYPTIEYIYGDSEEYADIDAVVDIYKDLDLFERLTVYDYMYIFTDENSDFDSLLLSTILWDLIDNQGLSEEDAVAICLILNELFLADFCAGAAFIFGNSNYVTWGKQYMGRIITAYDALSTELKEVFDTMYGGVFSSLVTELTTMFGI